MERFELRNKIQKKYELENGQRITIKRLIEISENEKIDLKDLILILGCYKNAKYKTQNLGRLYERIRSIQRGN